MEQDDPVRTGLRSKLQARLVYSTDPPLSGQKRMYDYMQPQSAAEAIHRQPVNPIPAQAEWYTGNEPPVAVAIPVTPGRAQQHVGSPSDTISDSSQETEASGAQQVCSRLVCGGNSADASIELAIESLCGGGDDSAMPDKAVIPNGKAVVPNDNADMVMPAPMDIEIIETLVLRKDGKDITIEFGKGGLFRDMFSGYAGEKGSAAYQNEMVRLMRMEDDNEMARLLAKKDKPAKKDMPAKKNKRVELVRIDGGEWMTDIASVIGYLTDTSQNNMPRTAETWAKKVHGPTPDAPGHIELKVPQVYRTYFLFFILFFVPWYFLYLLLIE